MGEGLMDISVLLTFNKLKTIVKKAGLDQDAAEAMVISPARGARSSNNNNAWYHVSVSLAVEPSFSFAPVLPLLVDLGCFILLTMTGHSGKFESGSIGNHCGSTPHSVDYT